MPLSLHCGVAKLDNALLFYQVGTCREHFAAMKTHVLRIWCVLVPIIQLNAAEDFQWTKNNPGSFYYGTFPTGTFELQLIAGFNALDLLVCLLKKAAKRFFFAFLRNSRKKNSGFCRRHT